MAINTMGFEDASLLLSALYSQVAGINSATPTDTSSFVSMAQATLQAGYEPVMNAITQVLSKTLIAVRPYNRKFKGLEMTRERWGGIIRKINFGDNALDIGVPLDHVSDPTYELVDGEGVDQWAVKKPQVLETRYVGQNTYESSMTIFSKQLDVAFSSPEEFGAFMSGLMTHFSNQREQYLEMLSRSILDNLIGAKKILEDASVAGPHVIDLLAEYNTATGQSLTTTTVKLPANYPAFCKWCYAYIQHVSDMFTERTMMFQRPIDGFTIFRHTPKADQRMFMDADFLAHMTAEVLADTYHDNFLRYTEVEAVNYWQAALEPSTVKVKPVYLNADAEFVNASDPVEVTGIIGVLMDRDAAGYNLADDSVVTSPYNAKGQYYNVFNHVRIQLQNDLTEKAVVFCIGGSVNPSPPEPSGVKVYEGTFTTTLGEGDPSASTESPVALTVPFDYDTAPEKITVVYNNTDYEIPKLSVTELPVGISTTYGEEDGDDNPVFTTFPFYINFVSDELNTCANFLAYTEEAGEYSIAIYVEGIE